MTTCSDLIGATRRHLDSGQRPALDVLPSPVGLTDTVIPLTYATAVSAGGYLTAGLEVMYVWSVDQTAKTATVQRGMIGSAPATHATGDLVFVNPRFTDWEIFCALNADLGSLTSNGIFQIRSVDLTAVSGQRGYDFPFTGFQSVADIRWQVQNSTVREWRDLEDYTVELALPTTTFPSGQSLYLNGMLPTPGQEIRVRYRAALGTLADLTTTTADIGLPDTATDLPPLGAAITVMAGRPVRRADLTSQGDTRRQDEVHVGDVVNATAALRQLRQVRVAEEAQRLAQQWPNRTRARVSL